MGDTFLLSLFLMIIGIILISVGVYLYLLPSIIAYRRVNRNWHLIFILNILLGWTFLGWIICLVWALYKEKINSNSYNTNKYEELERLQKLKENGTLTEVEFENEKQKLLR